MSSTPEFEDFLAGEGPLAQALRTLEPFEPPARMAEDFRAMLASLPQVSMAFEPPARLQANVFAEIARQQAAQQPRREAVLQELAQGRSAGEALGATVRAETASWLKQQLEGCGASPQAAQGSSLKKSRPWWRFAAGGLTALLAVGISLHLMLEQPQVLEGRRWAEESVLSSSQSRAKSETRRQDSLQHAPAVAAPSAREHAPAAKAVQPQASMAERKEVAAMAETRQQAPARMARPAPASPPAEVGRVRPEPQLSAEADARADIPAAILAKPAVPPAPAAEPAPARNEAAVSQEFMRERAIAPAPRAMVVPAPAAASGVAAGTAALADKDVGTLVLRWTLSDDPHARLASLPSGRHWVLQCHPADEVATRAWLQRGGALDVRLEVAPVVPRGGLWLRAGE